MNTLLRLPFSVAETTVRTGLSIATVPLKVASAPLRLVQGVLSGDDDASPEPATYRVSQAPPPSVASAATTAPPVPRPATARPPRVTPVAPPAPAAARAPAPPSPGPEAELLGDVPAHVDRAATPVASFGPADDASATLSVEAPWDGYDRLTATEIVGRLRGADEAVKAVVLLYERQHRARRSILDAAGG
jgi:hypothetical protein